MNSQEILIFKAFVNAINNADIEVLKKLMLKDHIFIDAAGRKEEGSENMIRG